MPRHSLSIERLIRFCSSSHSRPKLISFASCHIPEVWIKLQNMSLGLQGAASFPACSFLRGENSCGQGGATVQLCNCATVHWVAPPGKIALCAQSLHHLAYCTAPWYLHCLTCTRFYTWYRHTLPPAAFYLSFSFTHFDVKLLCFLFFGSRFGHNLWHFILASIKILISTFRQHSTP